MPPDTAPPPTAIRPLTLAQNAARAVDPFGHSGFQGSMLSSPISGVNGLYVARMDYQDIAQRKTTKSTEMYWAPSPSMPNQGGVLGLHVP